MINYDKNGNITRPKPNVALINKITGSRYLVSDLSVVDVDGQKYIHPKYSNKPAPLQHFGIENWEKFVAKIPTLTISERNSVSLEDLKITSDTDTFNILLIAYLKEMSKDRIITTNPKRLKDLLAILRKKPEVPFPWKYVEEILEYVTSNKDLFFAYLMKDEGKVLFNRYINLN